MLPGRSRRTKRNLPWVRSSLMRRALLARSVRVGINCGLRPYSVKSRLWSEKLGIRASRAWMGRERRRMPVREDEIRMSSWKVHREARRGRGRGFVPPAASSPLGGIPTSGRATVRERTDRVAAEGILPDCRGELVRSQPGQGKATAITRTRRRGQGVGYTPRLRGYWCGRRARRMCEKRGWRFSCATLIRERRAEDQDQVLT